MRHFVTYKIYFFHFWYLTAQGAISQGETKLFTLSLLWLLDYGGLQVAPTSTFAMLTFAALLWYTGAVTSL